MNCWLHCYPAQKLFVVIFLWILTLLRIIGNESIRNILMYFYKHLCFTQYGLKFTIDKNTCLDNWPTMFSNQPWQFCNGTHFSNGRISFRVVSLFSLEHIVIWLSSCQNPSKLSWYVHIFH